MQVNNQYSSVTTLCTESNDCVKQLRFTHTVFPQVSPLLKNDVVERFYKDKMDIDKPMKCAMKADAIIADELKKTDNTLQLLTSKRVDEMEKLSKIKNIDSVFKKDTKFLNEKLNDLISENKHVMANVDSMQMQISASLKDISTLAVTISQEYMTAEIFNTEEQLYKEITMQKEPQLKNASCVCDKMKIAIEETAAEVDGLHTHPLLLDMIYSSDSTPKDDAIEDQMEE